MSKLDRPAGRRRSRRPGRRRAQFEAGQRSHVSVRVNLADPVEESYAVFLARDLEGAVNRQIIEQAAQKGQA